MKKLGALALLAVVCAFCGSASAQTMTMDHKATPVIRGSDNPDAISNDLAYHLVFIHLANLKADNKTKGHADTLIATIGLSPRDREVFVKALTDYKKKHDENISQKPIAYSAQRNDLVKSTRDYLAAHMTSDGNAYFDRYVRIEKSRMTITAPAK